MAYEDRIRIATPEGVDLDIPLAGLGSRTAAFVIDLVLQGLIFAACVLVFVVPFGDSAPIMIAIAFILLFAVQFGYHVAFEVFASGRTPGKRALGLRVVRLTGGPIGFRESAVRNLVRMVDLELTSGAAGIVSVVASSRNQRLGDMAAGTLVVRERTDGVALLLPPAVYNADLDAWDTTAVTDADLAAVRLFLERRDSLEATARARLADRLAEGLRPRVAGAPEGMVAEAFLWSLYAAKTRRPG